MPRFVVNPPTPNEIIVNLPGPQGPKGEDGTSITIKGTFTSASQLPTTPANISDAYIVGTDLYIWVGSWKNVGPFRGPTGPAGQQGIPGVQGPAGLQGPVGPKGDKGDTGSTGLTGAQGPKGDKGDAGTSGTYSQAAAGMPYVQGEGLITLE